MKDVALIGVSCWGRNRARAADELGRLGAICDTRASARERANEAGVPDLGTIDALLGVAGVPARGIGWVSEGGEQLGEDLRGPQSGQCTEVNADREPVEWSSSTGGVSSS